jgi:MFS family permease
VAHRAGDATGRYMGVFSLNFSLSMFLAPLVGNWIFAKLGGDALWPIMGGVALLVAAGIWAMRRTLDVPKPATNPEP